MVKPNSISCHVKVIEVFALIHLYCRYEVGVLRTVIQINKVLPFYSYVTGNICMNVFTERPSEMDRAGENGM